MATDDPAVIRAALREHGHDVPDRGRLSNELLAAYREITMHDDDAEPDIPGSYDGSVSDADFGGTDDLIDALTAGDPPEPAAPPARAPGREVAAVPAERKPRRVRQPRKPTLSDRVRGRGKPARRGKPAIKRPRVPIDRFAGRIWEAFARLATPVSQPIATTLNLQAPIAGMILEDLVKETFVDRALQPVVRAEEKAEKVLALVGPPVLVGAIQASQGLPDEQRDMREAILVPMLEESLTMWVRIAGDKLEEQQRRVAEDGPVREQVRQLLMAIFPPPPDGPDAELAAMQQMATA